MSGQALTTARPALTRETVQEISRRRREPDWLLALRMRALEAFERIPLPDQHTEGWRRTSLRGLDLDALDPLAEGASPTLPRASGQQRVLSLQEALAEPRLADVVQKHFASVVAPESDKFTALHYAFFNHGAVVVVPRGKLVEEPIWLDHNFDHAAFVHTLVILEDDSELRLVEDYQGAPGFASGVVEHVVGTNAHLRYVHLQRWAPDVWDFSWQATRLGRDSSVRTLNVALGSRLARNTVQVTLEGRGSQADLLAVVALDERQHVDFQTLQEHVGNATRSDLVIHDALRGRSSANFTGLIRINKSAHQTESSQQQKNILLSSHAKADSDPKLEILNNDVIRCTHGAAVGPVDAEMLFYLQSRGMDQDTAERLIVDGFFQSVLAKLALPSVQEAVWSAIEAKQSASIRE